MNCSEPGVPHKNLLKVGQTVLEHILSKPGGSTITSQLGKLNKTTLNNIIFSETENTDKWQEQTHFFTKVEVLSHNVVINGIYGLY